ncbi:hypothetical protein Msil_2663 [Methylocella silvestris BL2]|uniref:Molybdate ABC transporter substrate-binding protein n=1 Tax=Methylocella silvestris (strain DSM 15510 / CIP 108128 / LMG 27833 / NCIMB 13906 / BL2) TaxID=395965 RepID=B8EQ95_METSB|nr:hypothetical protein Msil_2663 [Methylocella silvestris BL2]
MLSREVKKLALGVSTALALLYSPAHATTIRIGATPSFSDALNDIIASFQNYYIINGNLTYNVVVTTDTTDNLKSAIVSGGATGPYDLFLSSGYVSPYDLATSNPTLVVGSPFRYAIGSLMLYSTSVDISAGLPSSLTKDFVIADPATDFYGKATAQVLATTPGILTALHGDHVKTRDDIGSTFAAVDGGIYGYGFVAKSQICQYYGGAEHYVDGTYHHEYRSNNAAHPYLELALKGIKIARTRATDEEAELASFINFLTGVGTSVGTDILKQYCYKIP